MGEIQIIPKPDYISWEDIRKVIQEANIVHQKNGFVMGSSKISAEQLEKRVMNGFTVVALDDGKLFGTASVAFTIGEDWFNKGKKTAFWRLSAVLTNYQGQGWGKAMDIKRFDASIEHDAEIFVGSTSVKNKIQRHLFKKEGWKEMRYNAYPGTDYYSVVAAKWANGCPYSNWYLNLRFFLSKIYTIIRYKPGRKDRFVFRLWNKAIRKLKKFFK